MQRQLDRIDAQYAAADPLKRLQFAQERLRLRDELAASNGAADLERLEKEFIVVAKSYGDRRGITYQAWREVGVSDATLRAAGIPKS